MFEKMKLAGFTLLLALVATPAMAAEPLVDTAWVKSNLGKPGIVFLDITSSPAAYARGHIPGAVYDGSLSEWTTEDGVPMDRKVSLD